MESICDFTPRGATASSLGSSLPALPGAPALMEREQLQNGSSLLPETNRMPQMPALPVPCRWWSLSPPTSTILTLINSH